MEKYSLGIDFGTESARFVLVRLRDGNIAGEFVVDYPNGVIDDVLPESDTLLGPYWALQEPRDYLVVLRQGVQGVLQRSGITGDQVAGIGIDFTSCTILPVDSEGTPLCWSSSFRCNPHSWVKLWKHRAAQAEADTLNSVARIRGEAFLKWYPTGISAEWMLPKVLQVLREAPEVFEAADLFLEAADWVVWQLTGNLCRNSCAAGYKALWSAEEGYPSSEYLESVDSRLRNLYSTKLRGAVREPGTRAGRLVQKWAEILGLPVGIPVAVPIIDAHAAVLGAGITVPGKMVLVMGTSICHMLLLRERLELEGVVGIVRDGIVPGLYAYESGQAAAGDMLRWFVENLRLRGSRKASGTDISKEHVELSTLASELQPESHGLVVLDWWNGSRFLGTSDVSGVIAGLTLSTKPEQLYLALIQSLGFGTRLVLDAIRKSGGTVEELYACGTLARNPLIAQVFANATGFSVKVLESGHVSAQGAAILGAVAAGVESGGYRSLEDACARMAVGVETVFDPQQQQRKAYETLYKTYSALHDFFAKDGLDIMRQLGMLRLRAHSLPEA